MKLKRYDFIDCVKRQIACCEADVITWDSLWCRGHEVADLEAKCSELEALNAEMLDIIELLHHCSDYWSEYYVPIGIVQRMEKVIAQAKGGANE